VENFRAFGAIQKTPVIEWFGKDQCDRRKYWSFFAQTASTLCKNCITTLVFEKNADFSAEKLANIAENCDHTIDPGCVKIFQNLGQAILVKINA
jgi:hypothetical protein